MIPSWWKGNYCDERCFIVGNGPSLKDQDLSRLEGEYVITCNKPHPALRPSVICISDLHRYKMFKDEIEAADCIVIFAVPTQECFRAGWEIVPQHALAVPMRLDLYVENGDLFGDDLKYVTCGRTVMLDLCAPLAFHLGFEDTYFLGFDNTAVGHFYEDDKREGLPPILPLIDKACGVMRRRFEEDGRRLWNATAGGALTTLERVDYASLF